MSCVTGPLEGTHVAITRPELAVFETRHGLLALQREAGTDTHSV